MTTANSDKSDHPSNFPGPTNSVQLSEQRFARQYLQLEPTLDFPEPSRLCLDDTQEFLYRTCFSEDTVAHPPPLRYRLRTLKELLKRIEESITDWDVHGISEDLTTSLATLLALPLPSETDAALQKSFVTYSLSLLNASPHPATITLLENRATLSANGTTGLRTWEAALHLGQYLCAHPYLIHAKRVLELGAGTGYLSILCARHLAAEHVFASDGSDDVVVNMAENLFLNGLEGSDAISPMNIRWGHTLTEVGAQSAAWDDERGVEVVLGADIVYDERIVPALVATLTEVSERWPGAEVVIASTERNRETLGAFERAVKGAGFEIEVADFPVPEGKAQNGPFYRWQVPIRIFHLRRAVSRRDT